MMYTEVISQWPRDVKLMVGVALASKLFDIYSALLLSALGCETNNGSSDGGLLAFIVYLTVCSHILSTIVENLSRAT